MAASRSPVDPLFAALAAQIYGPGCDVEQLWAISKSMPGADHVPSADPKKDRRLAAVGLGATGVAAVGGLHALKGTKDEHELLGARMAGKTIPPKPLGRVATGLAERLGPKKAAAAIGAGWGVLHGVELGADALAARAAVKNLQKKPQQPGAVAKGLPLRKIKLPHVEPESLVRADARARRIGTRLVGGGVATASAAGGYAAGRHTPLRRRPAPVDGAVAKSVVVRGTISKIDEDRRQVFGWANLAIIDGQPVTDLQGDYVPLEEIEKSAYRYMLTSRVGGHMHKRVSKFAGDVALHTSDIIESFVVTPEKLVAMGLAPDALPWGWWLGHQVNDEGVWQRVKSGELTGMSIHGSGIRTEALV